MSKRPRRAYVARLPCAAALWALLAAHAAAQPLAADPESVRLNVPDCLGASAEGVRNLVALELAPHVRLDAGSSDAAAEITSTVTCGDERVRIEVVHPGHVAPLHVELDLAAAAEPARTRLLALAIAELIATSRLEAEPPREAPKPAPAEAEEDTEAAPAADVLQWALWSGPVLSRAGEPATLLAGAGLGASRTVGPTVLLAELDARFGAADTLVAEVTMQLFSASLALSPALSLGAFDLTIGPGVRVGHARLSGRPKNAGVQGQTLGAAWFGPLAATSVQFRALEWAALRAAFELGYFAKPVHGLDAESDRLLALRGVWISASISAALLFR